MKSIEALGVRQAQVEERTVERRADDPTGFGHVLDPGQFVGVRARLEQVAHQVGIARIILDEKDANGRVRLGAGGRNLLHGGPLSPLEPPLSNMGCPGGLGKPYSRRGRPDQPSGLPSSLLEGRAERCRVPARIAVLVR